MRRRLTLLRFLLISSSCRYCNGQTSASSSSSSLALTTTKRSIKQTKIKTAPQSHLQSLPKVAPLLGESAIIDKETGRVYWQGGEQSLFHSTVGHTYLKNKTGFSRHVRSTMYSVILWISSIRFIAKVILSNIDPYLYSAAPAVEAVVSSMTRSHQRIRTMMKQVAKILRLFLVCLAILPKFNRTFLIIIGLFYFIESYTCSTRKYLDNVSTPENVETYLEAMKNEKPYVKWDIRCFHYEKRKILCMLLMVDLWKFLYKIIVYKQKDKEQIEGNHGEMEPLRPSIFTKKVVTYQSSRYYKFNSWEDETIGGIWKQGEASTTINSDFTKISMYKLLLFVNSKTRADYFIQQSKFVNEEGQKDLFAELSTKVEVQGYRKKLLIMKRKRGISQTIFRIQYYWLFTSLLLTVPFRINFSRHCDEVHITLVKETSTDMPKNSNSLSSNNSKSSWFTSPKSWFSSMSSSTALTQNLNDDKIDVDATLLTDNDENGGIEVPMVEKQEDANIEQIEKVLQEMVTNETKELNADGSNIELSSMNQIRNVTNVTD